MSVTQEDRQLSAVVPSVLDRYRRSDDRVKDTGEFGHRDRENRVIQAATVRGDLETREKLIHLPRHDSQHNTHEDTSRLAAVPFQISIPTIQAVMKAPNVPPIIERRLSWAISSRRPGTSDPIPPICMAMEPKLANPHSA
jgi:hypothetical protein